MLAAARDLRSALLHWFDQHRRDLPWRRSRDPYAIWVSEVMLQQTQVSTVIPYWRRFIERFPSAAALAGAELPDVLALWRGLGYYARARNLHRAAREIAARHGGVLPSTARELLALPGFGRYTAGAVASIAFGEAAPLVDGNVARVLARVFEVEGTPGDRAREQRLWALAAELVNGARPGDFNQALMELGATICRSSEPSCPSCPIQAHCGALAAGRVRELPPPRIRPAKRPLRMAVGVWRRGEAILLARRAERGLFGGLWELPAVEVSAEGDRREVARAFRPLFGAVAVGEPLGTVKRTLTHRSLTLDLFAIDGRFAPRQNAAIEEWRWVRQSELAALGISTAMERALSITLDNRSVRPGTRRTRDVRG